VLQKTFSEPYLPCKPYSASYRVPWSGATEPTGQQAARPESCCRGWAERGSPHTGAEGETTKARTTGSAQWRASFLGGMDADRHRSPG